MENRKVRKNSRNAQNHRKIEEDSSEEELNDEEIKDAEEKVRFARLKSSKEKFLTDLKHKDPNSKNLTVEQKMKNLIEKSERLANFLLTKHNFQKEFSKKTRGSGSKSHIMFHKQER